MNAPPLVVKAPPLCPVPCSQVVILIAPIFYSILGGIDILMVVQSIPILNIQRHVFDDCRNRTPFLIGTSRCYWDADLVGLSHLRRRLSFLVAATVVATTTTVAANTTTIIVATHRPRHLGRAADAATTKAMITTTTIMAT